MTVVTNTTPLNYLVLIGVVDLLPQIFDRLLAPQAVVDELLHPRAPGLVAAWAVAPPSWLEVHSIALPPDPALAGLESGEREAIMLAEQVGADLLVVDERAAWREAAKRGLTTMGTLGVLETASVRGLVSLEETLQRLRDTNFHMSDALLQSVLERSARRDQAP